jgi:hypothetical protein
MNSRLNFSQRRHLIHPIGPQTHVFGHFRLFRYCMNFGAKRVSFAMNAPDPPIGPQTHVLGHLRPFRYYTNFSAERVELVLLMHKFVIRSRVGIFRNERTRSTTFNPKHMFWHISERSVTP